MGDEGKRGGQPADALQQNELSLQRAFDDEIVRMERGVTAAAMVMSAVGLLLSAYVGLVVAPRLGVLLVGYSAMMLSWFTFVYVCLGRGVGTRIFPYVNPFVEISVPTGVIIIDIFNQGAYYAATSGFPLQLYGMMTASVVLRVRPLLPLVVAAVGAAEYALVYLFLLAPRLDAAAEENPALRSDMMLMRSVGILIGGLMGALVTAVLRRALGKASRGWRSQQLFGKYRIEEQLASGGMGTVHRAIYCPEGGFQRPVALKRIHPHLARHESFVSRFRNEAELSSRLTHQNIVQVLDFGRVEDTYFLAMEFVEGATLRHVWKVCQASRIAFPPRLCALLGREICEGLHFAHHEARDAAGARMRIVHCDLNPPNVLISRTGQVKILDFGIARAMGELRDSMTGKLEGKLGYMAPEQAREAPIDERCDLFAAAIILWELVAGERLFAAESEALTLLALIDKEVPSVGARRPDAKVLAWDAFFQRALCRDPAGRFQTAGEMGDALSELMRLEGAPAADELRRFLESLPREVRGPEVAVDQALEARREASTVVEGAEDEATREAPTWSRVERKKETGLEREG